MIESRGTGKATYLIVGTFQVDSYLRLFIAALASSLFRPRRFTFEWATGFFYWCCCSAIVRLFSQTT